METAEQKLITCILPKGVAIEVVKTLKTEKGIMSTNINNARGVGKITPLAYRGIAGQSEKEIMTVTVPDVYGGFGTGWFYSKRCYWIWRFVWPSGRR